MREKQIRESLDWVIGCFFLLVLVVVFKERGLIAGLTLCGYYVLAGLVLWIIGTIFERDVSLYILTLAMFGGVAWIFLSPLVEIVVRILLGK